MHVVRGDELEPELLRPGDELPVDRHLLGQVVVLQFQVEILRAEHLLEPVHRLARLRRLLLLNPLRDFAGQTAREHDQAVLVRREQFLVDARLVVIAGQVRFGREPDQVLVAGLVLGQQHEVMIHVAPAAGGPFLKPAARRHVGFATDDRFDALVARRLVEINRPVHRAVVGDGEGGELERMRPVHQPVQPAGPIEQRVLGVQVQMDEVRVRHRRQVTAQRQGGARQGCSPPSERTFVVARLSGFGSRPLAATARRTP